jgi:hypothetical protein
VFGLLQAPAATPEQHDVRKSLERLETEWNVAHVRGDAAALDRIFSDDIVVIVPGMRVMTQADAVGMFTSGRMKVDEYGERGNYRIPHAEAREIFAARVIAKRRRAAKVPRVVS